MAAGASVSRRGRSLTLSSHIATLEHRTHWFPEQQPESGAQDADYAWTDANWRSAVPVRRARRAAQRLTGPGGIAVDPDIRQAYARETISFSTGSAFEAPTAILGPRVARVGARFEW